MDRVSKFLKELDRPTRLLMETAMSKIIRNDLAGLDVKKLKGANQLFRVRIGSIRITCAYDGLEVKILSIERRSERTYRHL